MATIERRTALKLMALGALGAALDACGCNGSTKTPTVKPSQTPNAGATIAVERTQLAQDRVDLDISKAQVAGTRTAMVDAAKTKTATPIPENTQTSTATIEIRSTRVPTASSTPTPYKDITPTVTSTATRTLEATKQPEIKRNGVTFINVPSVVDAKTVDVAKGDFSGAVIATNIFAEPGGLLVGPDFGYTGNENPFGVNPDGWKTYYNSDGEIQVISPVSQEVLRWKDEAYSILPEGGFITFSAPQVTVELDKRRTIKLENQGEGHTYLLAIRGKHADGKQDTDANILTKVTDYIPGATLLEVIMSGYAANIGFLDSEQLYQKVATSHTTAANCGAEGCSRLTLVTFDVNTGAANIYTHTAGRPVGIKDAMKQAKSGWTQVYSNW